MWLSERQPMFPCFIMCHSLLYPVCREKFAGYVPHYKILTGNIFGLILKNKMAATGVSLSVIKSAYIPLIIGRRGLGW